MVFRVGVVASLFVLTACATTGATLGSGVGDRFLEHPPYYAGGSAGATHLLLVTLEGGQYWPRQTGWRGSKSVELGSGYVLPLPWLTPVETPVSVLQLTGVLVGRDGRGVRIGAEGIAAQRTPLLASAVGAQRLITDEDVDRARSVRREDLPDQPLAWRAALSRLVSDLTR